MCSYSVIILGKDPQSKFYRKSSESLLGEELPALVFNAYYLLVRFELILKMCSALNPIIRIINESKKYFKEIMRVETHNIHIYFCVHWLSSDFHQFNIIKKFLNLIMKISKECTRSLVFEFFLIFSKQDSMEIRKISINNQWQCSYFYFEVLTLSSRG